MRAKHGVRKPRRTWRTRWPRCLEMPKIALTRGLKIAKALNELQVVEPAALAEALLTKAEGRSEFQSPASEATHADYVKQILEWDPTKARKVVGLALPKEGSPQQGFAGDPRLGRKDAFAGRRFKRRCVAGRGRACGGGQIQGGQGFRGCSEANRLALRHVGLLGKALSEG